MFTYKLDKATKLGEYDSTYGQVYWCESPDEPKPLKFNSQNQDIKAGDTIEAEASENRRTSPKPDSNKEPVGYLQLKKVHVVSSMQQAEIPVFEQADTPAFKQDESGFTVEDRAQLQRIEDGINHLLGL